MSVPVEERQVGRLRQQPLLPLEVGLEVLCLQPVIYIYIYICIYMYIYVYVCVYIYIYIYV